MASCSKDTAHPQATPAPIASDFDQDFTLHYQQQAVLPLASTLPDLTITATEFDYSYCPKGIQCLLGTSVWPTLTVADAQGRTQLVKLPANKTGTHASGWLDTTSVRANGHRYLLYYKKWQLVDGFDETKNTAKQDLTITLRVTKVN